MTAQQYKERAVKNGYDLGAKTDKELLYDYAFHKAACAGMCEEAYQTMKISGRCPGLLCRQRYTGARVYYHRAARVRFNIALDGIDENKDIEHIWNHVLAGGMKKDDIEDGRGNLLIERLP